MASVPFNKLAVELQLLVWHHAGADVGQVITGDVDYDTNTLTLRGGNLDRAKDYLRLLSICHNSRQEALRRPLVFFFQSIYGTHYVVNNLNEFDSTQSLPIKQWHFGHVFSDIIMDVSHTDIDPMNQNWDTNGPPLPDLMDEALVRFFSPTIRRVHAYGEPWNFAPPRLDRHSWLMDKPVDTTFSDADALHFRAHSPDKRAELREVVRQDVHGEVSQNIAQLVLVAVDDNHDILNRCASVVKRKNFIKMATRMRSHFPDLEYVSLLSWRLPASFKLPWKCGSEAMRPSRPLGS